MSDPKVPNYVKFLHGGFAGMISVCFVHSFDFIKTRMQLPVENGAGKVCKHMMPCFRRIMQQEGTLALYSDFTASLVRQATYTKVRLGTHQILNDYYIRHSLVERPPLGASMSMGISAGGVAALVATPADVCLVRIMADGRVPLEQRRNYANIFDALIRAVREEGLQTLWRGCVPTVTRAMVINVAHLASYTVLKSIFNSFIKEGFALHLVASLSAVCIASIVSLPFDVVKTRIQIMKTSNDKSLNTDFLNVMKEIIRSDGVLALWKGFTPYVIRIGPQAILILAVLQNLNRVYLKKRLLLKFTCVHKQKQILCNF